jgi:hypothetical protein
MHKLATIRKNMYGEYVVKLYEGLRPLRNCLIGEYYADCLQDARSSARIMGATQIGTNAPALLRVG